MTKKTILLVGLCMAIFSLQAIAQTYTKRLALVVGNSSYTHGGALKNPVNDARSMAGALQAMGFDVLRFENVTQSQLKQAINTFGIKLRDYEVGLFYYAGHGIQHKGFNYMIPVEVDLQAAEQIEFDCVAADRVLAYMESASTKVNIIIMDACRNNPFERSWNRSANGSGLAMMNAPTGTLIAYATAPGKVASDGESANGLYTSILLQYMKDPSLNLEQIFKRVRTEVTEKSNGSQVPWETTSLTGGDFFLNTKKTETKQAANTKPIEGTNHEKALQYYTQAQAKYDQGLFEEAIQDYSKAIEFNPLDVLSFLWRGHAKYSIGFNKQVEDETMLEASIADYSKAIELSPGDAEAYYYRANAKKLLKRYNDAIPDFTLAIRYDPKKKESYYYRGLTYYLLQKYGAGIEDFSKAIELQADYSSAYYWRGMCKYAMEDYILAVEDFDRTISLDPNNAEARLYKADSYYGRMEYETAIRFYQDVLKINPTSTDALMYIAHSYYGLKKYPLALEKYAEVLKIDQQYADAYYWRSKCYLIGLNDKANALTEIKKAMAIFPDDSLFKQYYNDNFK
jgi:tetratricopeptide (TPR) repeat protein